MNNSYCITALIIVITRQGAEPKFFEQMQRVVSEEVIKDRRQYVLGEFRSNVSPNGVFWDVMSGEILTGYIFEHYKVYIHAFFMLRLLLSLCRLSIPLPDFNGLDVDR